MPTPEEDILDVDIASDRSRIIGMVALFEDAFADIIKNRFVVLSSDISDRVFNERGPLGTFSAKIDVGFAMGLYGTTTRANLHNIRRIRNCFAHRHEAKDFEHARVKQLCNNLSNDFVTGPCGQYSGAEKYHQVLINILLRLSAAEAKNYQCRPTPPELLP